MTTDDLAGYFRCLCDPACSTQPWPMDFSHSNRCTEANANTRRPDGLASLLAIHGSWRWTCDSAGFDTRDYGILCDCGKFIEASQESDDGARLRHGEHVAAVIAAAGWVKGREEFGVRDGEDVDEIEPPTRGWAERVAAANNAHLRRNGMEGESTVVRRYVTDWEPA